MKYKTYFTSYYLRWPTGAQHNNNSEANKSFNFYDIISTQHNNMNKNETFIKTLHFKKQATTYNTTTLRDNTTALVHTTTTPHQPRIQQH